MTPSPQPPKQTEPVQDAIKLIIEEQSLGLARGPKFDNALTVVCHAVLQQSAELERLKAERMPSSQDLKDSIYTLENANLLDESEEMAIACLIKAIRCNTGAD